MFPYLNSPFAKIRGISKEIRKPVSLEKFSIATCHVAEARFWSFTVMVVPVQSVATSLEDLAELVQPAAPAVPPAPQPPQHVQAAEGP